ncbi:MAG: 3-oxoacyl-ACP reductase FabG [Clostridia bacterium]|nr:3-oxoacyl-ACP reductase FabG [Clostridia bacterium]
MKTVLITGGSRGIGRALVIAFSKAGYRVAFTYKSSASEAEALSHDVGALAIRADSASEAEIIAAVKKTTETLGEIDVLINNAAISSFSLLTDLSLEEWNNTLSVNLTAPFIYSKAVIPSMVRRRSGRIINVSSMWGVVGSSCEAHYSASKAGLIGLTKALAKELGPSGITVNCIAPGVIATDMNKALDPDAIRALEDETPLMRMGRPEEVAEAALFLAGDGAGFITGDVMNLSGGYIV